jgi:aspartyl/glutamyl-tRNA(Asn/Gln) amidotransferase C subunit
MAKISLSDDEVDSVFDYVVEVMGVVETISEFDFAEYDCSDEAVVTELREDEVVPSLPLELILSNAAEKHDSFFTA